MKGVKVAVVDNESSDWVGMYINGKLRHEGHDISDNVWINIIRDYKNFRTIDSFTVSDEYMEETGLPDEFVEIPTVELID